MGIIILSLPKPNTTLPRRKALCRGLQETHARFTKQANATMVLLPSASFIRGLAEGRQPSKPTWVSVQDVVLNSLDRPRNQVNHSQSSATFTQAQNTMFAHVAMVLVGVSRLDTK